MAPIEVSLVELYEKLRDGVAAIHLDGYIIESNATFRQLLGYGENELRQRTYLEITPHKWHALENRIIRDQVMTRGYSETYEKEYIRKDGSVFPVELQTYLSRDPSGKPIGMWAFVRDISERKRLQDELRLAKEAAENASRIKSEFIDIAAHELRTPITPLLLLIQAAQRQAAQGTQISISFLNTMEKQIQRLRELVNSLLDASRLERGGLTFNPVETDLTAFVKDCVSEFKLQAPHRQFTFTTPKQPVFAEIDPDRVHQLLGNLLDNALKYSPEQSPIEVGISAGPEWVRVSVTDHGPGIPKERQGQLFTRFFRVISTESLRRSGLGLGLFICRRIAELHGGRIGLDSEPGKGSTFYFELPRKRSP